MAHLPNQSNCSCLYIPLTLPPTTSSKAITFCSPNKFTWRALFDHHMMNSYFDKVNQDGTGPDGIVIKLDCICRTLNYIVLRFGG